MNLDSVRIILFRLDQHCCAVKEEYSFLTRMAINLYGARRRVTTCLISGMSVTILYMLNITLYICLAVWLSCYDDMSNISDRYQFIQTYYVVIFRIDQILDICIFIYPSDNGRWHTYLLYSESQTFLDIAFCYFNKKLYPTIIDSQINKFFRPRHFGTFKEVIKDFVYVSTSEISDQKRLYVVVQYRLRKLKSQN